MAAGRSSGSSPPAIRSVRRSVVACCLLAAAMPFAAALGGETTDVAATLSVDDPGIARAWRVLRQVDCARCHGRSYEGLAAPSIVGYAAAQTPEQFVRLIIDGDPSRGMPGYRANALVVANLGESRRYFAARATGAIGPDWRPRQAAADR